MFEEQYNYKTLCYSITETEEMHHKLKNDLYFFEKYMQERIPTVEVAACPGEAVSAMEKESKSDGTLHIWNSKNTKLFLHLYSEKKELFRDPKIKKRKLWCELAEELRNGGYVNATEDVLDRKMRNMKKTYRSIKDNNSKTSTGRGRIQWEYYNIFDEIFANDVCVNPGAVISSLRPTVVAPPMMSPLEQNVSSADSPAMMAEACESPTKSPPRKKSFKGRELNKVRKEMVAAENARTEAINFLSTQIKESNEIQRERNALLQQLIEKS